jgi:hypothetical protein
MAALGKTPLDKLNDYINWEDFRPALNEVLAPKEQEAPGGASHYDNFSFTKIVELLPSGHENVSIDSLLLS